MQLAHESERSNIEPVGDTWPLPDIQHLPTPPTDFVAPVLLLLCSLGGWLLQRSSSLGLAWLPALYAVTAGVVLLRLASFVFGRSRISPHHPRRLDSGKWLLSTWARTHSFSPETIQAPQTREELLQVVELHGRAGRKMKPAGSLHSWSDCAVTQDVSIQTGRLNRVLHVDKAAMTIQAEAGIRMRELYARMEQEGLALMSLPNVDTIQLGGAVANATHGTCIRAGSLCSMVTELELVHFVPAADGPSGGRAECLRLRRDATDARERHLFDAAVASIGTLGVVYSVTLQCVRPYHCYVHERALPFEELRNRFAETARQHYSVRFMILVGLDIVFTKLQVPIEGPLVRATAKSITNSRDMLVIKLIAFAGERNPRTWRRLRKAIRWLSDSTARASTEQMVATHQKSELLTWYDGELESRFHAAFVGAPFVNLEYGVPLDRADAAILELRDICRRYPMHSSSTLSLRPVGADERGYLAPPNGQPVMYVDIPYIADLESTGLYAELEKKCLEHGGRCSWSRLLHSEPGELVKNYPHHAAFVRAKHELDPLNLFSNPFSDRICNAARPPDEATRPATSPAAPART